MDIKKTHLHSFHVKSDAKMTGFAGYDMPLQYPGGARNEHRMVRDNCGLFDVSHMGRFLINCKTSDSVSELENLVTCPVSTLPPLTGSYGLICKPDGKCLDDVFLFCLDTGLYLLVVNAANSEKIYTWIKQNSSSLYCEDISEKSGMIALQGPRAIDLLRAAGYSQVLASIGKRNQVSPGNILKEAVFTRTGYTGEDGVELYGPNEIIAKIWHRLLEIGKNENIECGPAGLAARDSLRFEAGYALYGHELSEDINPVQARVKWACKLRPEQPDFIGKAALVNFTSRADDFPVLRTLRLVESAVPRQNMKVFDASGNEVGWVCSGMACPTLGGFYANVFLKNTLEKRDGALYLEVRGVRKEAEIVKRPIYSSLK